MKRTRFLTTTLLTLVLICGIFAIFACGTESIKLTAPTVTLNGNTATWSANDLADKFEISVDGNLSYIENSVTSRKLTDGQSFKVRAIGDGTNYITSDWSNSVTYTKEVPTYTITWKNGDAVLETDENVPYGEMPIYNGAEPTKMADAEYVYLFIGWSPTVSPVTGDVTYVAKFEAIPNSYTIIWKNGDVELEKDEGVTFGSTPSYDGEVPTKAATAQYTYTFSGWAPNISVVTESITYQAQFVSTVNTYTVTFYSEDGNSVLNTVTVEYGSCAEFSKPLPIKNATEGHTYIFEKWVTECGGSIADDLTNVVENRAVYASFKAFARTVTVYIVPNNSDYGTVSVSTLNNIPYGAAITALGNTITVNGQTVTANASPSTAQYTYEFVNWTAEATVGNDTVITANFSRIINSFTVIWKNGNSVLETDEGVPYGTTPVYNGAVPTKEADSESSYTFIGWSPAISSVTGDVTYTAQFTSSSNNHIVIFYDDDGATELGRAVVSSGTTAVYPNAFPTKEATAQVTYTFDKWVTTKGGSTEADLTNITENKSVYASYSESPRTYTVTFCGYDGIVIAEATVEYGKTAEGLIPELPPRESRYRFDGWKNSSTGKDVDLTSITSDITVKASYTKLYLIQFLDYDNSILPINYCENCAKAYKYSQLANGCCPDCTAEISVIYDQWVESGKNAIAPESPVRDGYRFTGWNTGFTSIADDLTVTAQYIKQYKVTFIGFNRAIIKEETIDAGAEAIAPKNEDVAVTGYTFIGWDKVFTSVSSDLTVTAIYEIKTYTVTFMLPDGTVLGKDESVEHGFSAVAPDYPEVYLKGTGINTTVYGFTKWDTAFNKVEENLIVKAEYNTVYTKPVILVDFSGNDNQTATIYIYSHSSVTINALELGITYKTDAGKFIIDSVSLISDGLFGSNYQQVINNNEMNYTFAWSDVNGTIKYNGCADAITFNLRTVIGGVSINEDTFVVEYCNLVVSDANGEKLKQITPVIVYR